MRIAKKSDPLHIPTLQEQIKELGLDGAFLCPYCAETVDLATNFCAACHKRFREPLGAPIANKLRLNAKQELMRDLEAVAAVTLISKDEGENAEGIFIDKQEFADLKRKHLSPSQSSEEGHSAEINEK